MRSKTWAVGAAALALAAGGALSAPAAPAPHILQQPALSHGLIAFSYAGDLWTVPKAGGRASRLTTGVGVESAPVFSPDGATIAFTGEYDGNVDVFTIPAAGGTPKRVTFHPAPDYAVGWTPDGKSIIFRSTRLAASRYTQLFTVPAAGGVATPLPLPMAYDGRLSPDGRVIAYSPLPPAFGFNFTNYVSWGNYKGGTSSTIRLTNLATLDSIEVPHADASDLSPVFLGGKVYFLSARNGSMGIFSYDPAAKTVSEVYHNVGSQIRTLSTDGSSLVFDRLGEIYTLEPGGQPQLVPVDVTGDLPDVRPRIKSVAGEVEHVHISPTGLRAVVEAHGEILTVPANPKKGAIRNITNTTGAAEREPAWSPDGQSIAYFSDASGLYALHVASQTGAQGSGANKVKTFPLAKTPAYYFSPRWSPDSKKIAFYDNRLTTWVLDVATGKLSQVGEAHAHGGFTAVRNDMAWSPDSRWLVYSHSTANKLHVLMLYAVDTGTTTQLTDDMADAASPAFDRNGKYLYFLASNNSGAVQYGLDMTTDLYRPTASIYALSLKAATLSPTAPEAEDEKAPAETKAKGKDGAEDPSADEPGADAGDPKARPSGATKPKPPEPTPIDLQGQSLSAIARRIAALPLPPRRYEKLATGKAGVLYVTETLGEADLSSEAAAASQLSRYVIATQKSEKLADQVLDFEISADGEKMLLTLRGEGRGPGGKPRYVIAGAGAPVKAGEGALSLAGLEVRVDPPAEWRQMYHEVWRIERAYFYDPNFHGVDTVAEENRLEPYAAAIQSRTDLNYLFQEMLTGFSVGHLRGGGGAVPGATKVAGGLLGADYVIKNGRWCLSKILTGGTWSPDLAAPLAQPGLNIHEGDCILAVNGEAVTADKDIQEPLEGTAGHAVTLRIASGEAAPRDVTVIPVASESRLRNIDWIDANKKRVDELSNGQLAYVYLPDTAAGGFTNFNRYYFAQSNKKGAIIDERFNGGGQMADYIIEVLSRKVVGYWSSRYGAIEHTPSAGVYGPKVMIANEQAGSGGDALPWMFKHAKLGPLVGKRTWGGLVGISDIPVLMDGGQVTSPSSGFFSPDGQWDVENHGVDPDVVVEQDPKAVAAGRDPQLEAAVALALDALKKSDAPEPRRPAYPNYNARR